VVQSVDENLVRSEVVVKAFEARGGLYAASGRAVRPLQPQIDDIAGLSIDFASGEI
jgi:hypothetical protein